MRIKKPLYRLLYFSGSILNWKWLAIASGLLLLPASQSCRSNQIHCYTGPPSDTTSVSQPVCYGAAVEYDSTQLASKVNENMEIE